jgi:uncharacterized protein YxeA
MKKKLIGIIVICAFILAAFCYLWSNKGTKQASEVTTEATAASTSEEDADTQTDADTSEESTVTENSTAKQEYEDDLDEIEQAEDPTDDRASTEEEELFRIALLYIDEYDLDSTDFTIQKALIVQNLTNDYLYIQYTSGGEKAYTCYTYDGCYFREESQSVFKKEYKEALAVKENDEYEDYGICHSYSKKELKTVNEMF